jgi:hypothetical protein
VRCLKISRSRELFAGVSDVHDINLLVTVEIEEPGVGWTAGSARAVSRVESRRIAIERPPIVARTTDPPPPEHA